MRAEKQARVGAFQPDPVALQPEEQGGPLQRPEEAAAQPPAAPERRLPPVG